MESTDTPRPAQLPITPLLPFSAAQISLFAAFIAAIFFVALVYIRNRTIARRGSAILLVGPSDAGKTAILTSLSYAGALPTHTSIQPTITSIRLSPDAPAPIKLIDVPGHPRIRDQFTEYLPDAKAVVFVVDTSTIARNGAAVAEHLHLILHAITSLPPSVTPPALLLLAHKADLLSRPPTSTPSPATLTLATERVRTVLERELEKRRIAASGSVGVEGLGDDGGDEGGAGGQSGLGGLECLGEGGAFSFSRWDGGAVECAGTWVKVARLDLGESGEKGQLSEKEPAEGEDGLEGLRRWLEELS
ncbi:hypothetical protein BOTBODRAFT_29229 [Botryobasidium botryosum FD-172 SS1]|uniref:Signal recognition particle receptor subunit beta n=1 Tax=Botryobasidium botryosum (strain FD-172 SS1) TaxID=930990 RepID=A0A067MQS8_BOTB1|nr:hypothetical protein BOTBODRAFT_29229 [Botryobasidium botryosum FD-172 SS1]